MKTAWPTATVAVVAALMVGCGGGKYASPKATMETLRAAAKAGDKEAVRACFCEDTRKKIAEMEQIAADFAKENPELAGQVDQDKVTRQMMEKAKDAEVEYGEQKIDGDVRESMSRSQREFYLQQQLKAIKDELGQFEESGAEVDDLVAKLENNNYPEHVRAKADDEIKRL